MKGDPAKNEPKKKSQNVHVEDLTKLLHKKEKSESGILLFDKLGTR